MKFLLCFVIVAAIGQLEARPPGHQNLDSEIQCLSELNLEMKNVLPHVHVEADPSNEGGIGEYLACVWKKKGIMLSDGAINIKKVVDYLADIYDPDEELRLKMTSAVTECDLQSNNEGVQGVLINNCMIRTTKKLGISPKPL